MHDGRAAVKVISSDGWVYLPTYLVRTLELIFLIDQPCVMFGGSLRSHIKF